MLGGHGGDCGKEVEDLLDGFDDEFDGNGFVFVTRKSCDVEDVSRDDCDGCLFGDAVLECEGGKEEEVECGFGDVARVRGGGVVDLVKAGVCEWRRGLFVFEGGIIVVLAEE